MDPFTIKAEGRRGDRLVFCAGDTGRALGVPQTQEAELRERLAGLGIGAGVFRHP
ncbi:hypothetical protein ACFU7Y_04545 [Kitasatospora sp. NPDC057542]|uniref:hypothetical protein n=1 Tax=Streptomycetaceae TaxID=2062 RepID=UPI001CCB28ED|nr:hypothetical protein [Streptomyces sp. LS1784]